MKHTPPSLALSACIVTFLVACVVLTLPAQWNFWGDAVSQTSVSLTVIASSVSSSSTSSSTSSASSSDSSIDTGCFTQEQVDGILQDFRNAYGSHTGDLLYNPDMDRDDDGDVDLTDFNLLRIELCGLNSSSSGNSSSDQLPNGHYRHHETRMAEIILDVMRRRRERDQLPPVHTVPPEFLEWNIPINLFPEDFWLLFGHDIDDETLTLTFPPVGTHGAAGSSSSSRVTASGELLPNVDPGTLTPEELKQVKDLNPEDYGWVTSTNNDWSWETAIQSLFRSCGLEGNEWILWAIFGLGGLLGLFFGLRLHDFFLLFCLPRRKRAYPRGGKAVASK